MTCGYVHEVGSNASDGHVRYDGWECSREPHTDGQCVFHAPSDAVDDETVTEAFLAAVDTPGREAKELVGARLGELDCSYATLDGPDNYPIVVHGAEIDRFSLRKATVTHGLRCEDTRIHKLNCFDAAIEQYLNLGGARVGEPEFDYAHLAGVSLDETQIDGFGRLVSTRVAGSLSARGLQFVPDETFADGCRRSADFTDGSSLRLDDSGVAGVELRDTTVDRELDLSEATIEGTVSVAGATLHEVTLTAAALDGVDTTDATIDRLRIDGFDGPDRLVFAEVTVENGLVRLDSTDPACVFVDSTLGDVELAGANGGFDRVAVLNTAFDGFEFTDYVGDLGDVSHEIHPTPRHRDTTAVTTPDSPTSRDPNTGVTEATLPTSDPDANASDGSGENDANASNGRPSGGEYRGGAESLTVTPARLTSTYLRAKNGADEMGDNTAAAEFFIREMDARLRRHRELAQEASIGREWVIHWWRTAANWTLKWTSGYGERPSLTFLVSLGVVGVFSVVYGLLGVPLPFEGPGGFVVFSFQSFVSLILGGPQTTDSVSSLATAVEGFLGAFLIALFVFTLTRSVDR